MDNFIILVLKSRFFLPDNNASERAIRNFKISGVITFSVSGVHENKNEMITSIEKAFIVGV